jgi:hypothetical protein
LLTISAADAGVWSFAIRSDTGISADEVLAEIFHSASGIIGSSAVYTPNGAAVANAVAIASLTAGQTIQFRARQVNTPAAARTLAGTISATRIGANP